MAAETHAHDLNKQNWVQLFKQNKLYKNFTVRVMNQCCTWGNLYTLSFNLPRLSLFHHFTSTSTVVHEGNISNEVLGRNSSKVCPWHKEDIPNKKKLLQRLLIENENVVSLIDFLKSVNMNIVMELITESWGEIKAFTLPRIYYIHLWLNLDALVCQTGSFKQWVLAKPPTQGCLMQIMQQLLHTWLL